ncbi:MAG: nicotinamide-nucleotide amidohydrolase family protein [Pseudomonadota bacterium]
MTVAALLDALRARSWTVTAAESCTGGMVAAAITDIAGSSDVFERGFVTYSNRAKREMLGVAEATLAAHGAVSEDVVREMAAGALEAAGADLAVAISGIAGPGGSERKPEGRVCFAVATADGVTAETVEFGALGRGAVRAAARDHALARLLEAAAP